MNYSLLENYEWVGTFWFKDQETCSEVFSEKFSGKLSYSALNGISLNIIWVDAQHKSRFDNNRNIKNIPMLKGIIQTTDGIQYVTLLDVDTTSLRSQYGHYGKIDYPELKPRIMIVGKSVVKNFLSIQMTTLYNKEFTDFQSKRDFDSLLTFTLNDNIKVEIKPIFKPVHWRFSIKPIIKPTNEKDKEKIEEHIKTINDELQKLTNLNVAIAENKADNCEYQFSKQNNSENNAESIAEIDSFIKAIHKYRAMKSLLLGKYAYIEKVEIDFNSQDTVGNKYIDTNFIFISRMNHMHQSISKEDKKDNRNPNTQLLNIALLNNDIMEKYGAVYDDNLLLIDCLMESLFEIKSITLHHITERFVSAMALLERNSTEKKDKKEKSNKYDNALRQYSSDKINKKFLEYLTNNKIDEEYKMKLTDILQSRDTLKNHDTYQLGAILSFLRNNLLHKQKGKSGIKNLDTETKNKYIEAYEEDWLKAVDNNNMLYAILSALYVLLYKILYTKIGIKDKDIKTLEEKLYIMLKF